MKKFILIIAGLLAISHSAQAKACTISTNNDFKFMTYDATACPDPDPKYKDHVYFEITDNIHLTQPFTIPASKVHIKGNFMHGAAPLIIANYNVMPYYVDKSTPLCIVTLEGDNIILENIKLDTKTYRDVASGPVKDNVICIKGSNNFLNVVRITDPAETPSSGKWPLTSNGVLVLKPWNTLRKMIISLTEGIGMILKAGNTTVTQNTISTSMYPGIIISTKDQTLTGNTIKGVPAIYYEPPCDIPVGQAANIALLNTLTGSLSEDNLNTFESIGHPTCKEIMSPGFLATLSPCGDCMDTAGATWKIPYTDSGSCQPTSWCTADMTPSPPSDTGHPPVDGGGATAQEGTAQETTEGSSGGGPSDQISNQTAIATGPQDGTGNTGTGESLQGTPTGTPTTSSQPFPAMVPQVNYQSGGGGCSLIR